VQPSPYSLYTYKFTGFYERYATALG
jgi:hypothetical protein